MLAQKRSFISAVVGTLLTVQYNSNAIAESNVYVLLVKADDVPYVTKRYTEKPKSEWGWWSKFDWESYRRSGISKKDMNMLEMAAKYGSAQAQYVLGMLYSMDEKSDQAMYLLGLASGQGHTSAKFTYNYYMNTADNEFGIGC